MNSIEYEHSRMTRAGAEEDRTRMRQRQLNEKLRVYAMNIRKALYGPIGEYVATDPYSDDRVRKFLKTTSRIKEKDIEMEKTVTNSLIPEGVIPIATGLDLASKLDSTAIDKLSMYGDKNSTPEIGKLCGMRLLLDLSGAPEDAKYELYFEARTLLERIIDRMEKQAAVEVSKRSEKWKKSNSIENS